MNIEALVSMDVIMYSEHINRKLVRDRIPAIIEQSGRKPIYHRASEEEYRRKLLDKLIEEATEFASCPSEEELADVLEVIVSLVEAFEFYPAEVESIRLSKLREKGGFEKRLILEEIKDECDR